MSRCYISEKGAAEYLGVSRSTIWRWEKHGLPCHKINGRKLYLKEEIDEFVGAGQKAMNGEYDMTLGVKYVDIVHNEKPLDRQHDGDAGFDVRANESGIIKPGEIRLVHTGIYLEIQPGYEVQVRPRSGLALKHGVTICNTPGTIDSSYKGECCCILVNHGTKDFAFACGDRIAQFVVQKVPCVELIEVDELSESDRGSGGFGSSGVK
jgi:dUTP pyrophosphatase